jgi:F-type H+-transporting ATPase subunit a
MGEESSWFDYLPGLKNLEAWAQHYLGRQDPSNAFYFRGGPFQESHFTLIHVVTTLMVLIFVAIGALRFRAVMRRGGDEAIVPPARLSLRNLFEILAEAIFGLMTGILGEKNARKYLPIIGTLAFFILFSNILALIPGFLPPTTTLKTNLALALFAFALYNFEGIRAHGAKSYLKHFLGPYLPLAPLMIIIEVISHLARPVSLSLRLLGNMVSDHKVVAVFFGLVPLLVPVPFLLLGTLVAVVQTLVFCLLTMVYINLAVQGHDEHEHDHAHSAH